MDNNQNCLEAILSNDYLDILTPNTGEMEEVAKRYNAACYQIINAEFAVLHTKADIIELCNYEAGGIRLSVLNDVGIYGPVGIKDVSNEEVYRLAGLSGIGLTGKDIIVGIVDSGIDYRLPIFKNKDGTSKIISIWDQTIQEKPPKGYYYGTEYTQEDINQALESDDPKEVVPHSDDTGHGTYLAGIAAGGEDKNNDFIGVAPDSELIVVKLKQSKKVMREFQMIFDPTISTYQDTDIMIGMNYLLEKANEFNKPIVIPLCLSSNDGTHDGMTILERYISGIASIPGVVIVVAAGDEADKKHHYQNTLTMDDTFQDVIFNVDQNEKGFQLVAFNNAPDIISIALISPSGESFSRVSPQYFTEDQVQFLLEKTIVCINHYLYPGRVGQQTYVLKFYQPTPGLWTLRVFPEIIVRGRYDIWLPREGIIEPETKFLYTQPDTTITIPTTTRQNIAVGAYNHVTGSLYTPSGRGYTRNNLVKPDLVAPGVSILGPFPNNIYSSMTGTNVSAAIVAGTSALLLEWGITNGNNIYMNTLVVNNYLIKGARRRNTFTYPNNAWGYGELDLDNVFNILKQQ